MLTNDVVGFEQLGPRVLSMGILSGAAIQPLSLLLPFSMGQVIKERTYSYRRVIFIFSSLPLDQKIIRNNLNFLFVSETI